MKIFRLAAAAILASCSSATIVAATDATIGDDLVNVDPVDASSTDEELTIVDAKFTHDAYFVGIPDAASYDPTYACVSQTQYIECDYGDAGPCDVKSCLMFDAPICFNGRCYTQ